MGVAEDHSPYAPTFEKPMGPFWKVMGQEDLVRAKFEKGKGLVDPLSKQGFEKPPVAVVVPEDPVKGHIESFKEPPYGER